MYCKKCGAKNKDDARFCAKCGCDMTQKIIAQDHKKQKKTEKKPKPVEKKPKPAKKSTSNPILKSVKSKYSDQKESIKTLGYDYPKGGKDPKIYDGKASMIVMGYEDDEKKEAKYSLITSDGEDTYIMKIKFIDTDYTDSYKEIDYIVDCMYRGCSFTNSSYKVRTYKQFKNDEMGEKK